MRLAGDGHPLGRQLNCRPNPHGSQAGMPALQQRWPLARKFLDYLEANAEEYWQVPRFEMAAEVLGEDAGGGDEPEDEEEDEDESDEEDDLFSAAYEHVTYRDTTDDGVEGEMYETGPSATEFELVGEAERIFSRLSFLGTVAQLWKLAATASASGQWSVARGQRGLGSVP